MPERSWDRKHISDDELKQVIQSGIKNGISKTRLLDDLRSKKIGVGEKRFRRMWDELGGPIREIKGLF